MTADFPDMLPPEASLALAWTPVPLRPAMATALQLDRRLARIVARTTEPMLGQMRLAWWREALGRDPADRPRGDAVLDAIGSHWAGREAALIAMVDGWEVLVTAERLDRDAAAVLARGRGGVFLALHPDGSAATAARIAMAGARWALADAAAGVSHAEERGVLIAAGLAQDEAGRGTAGRLPPSLRGLAVLEALALRAMGRGGGALMAGRGAALTALRAAIFLT